MSTNLEVLADHYQKTFELTHKYWDQRNRTFLILIAVVASAALLTLHPDGSNQIITKLLLSYVEAGNDPFFVKSVTQFLPALIQIIFLIVILYLMVGLYHRTVAIIRNYRYLNHIEEEIRKNLSLSEDSYVFTREGKFYFENKGRFSWAIKYSYMFMLGGFLGLFYILTLIQDIKQLSPLLIVDILAAIPTFFFFIAYVVPSLRADRKISSALEDALK